MSLGSIYSLKRSFIDESVLAGSQQQLGAGAEEQLSAQLKAASLQQQQTQVQAAEQQPQPQQPAAAAPAAKARWNEHGATCLSCGIGIDSPGFQSQQEQRHHFKTDWHRYNVKRRLNKQPPVSEEQFESMLNEHESEVSSISGSSSSESDLGELDEEEGPGGGSRQRNKGALSSVPPQAMFTGPGGKAYAVWKCLLEQDHTKPLLDGPGPEQLLHELRKLRAGPGLFVVVLFRGGHFAAGVFQARREEDVGKGAGQKGGHAPPDAFTTLASKTFHRYVVRAKAGGKQSSKDATGKYARSAGSALRRYNEGALDRDVADLLASWRQYIDGADLIFVQAPSSNARSVFASAEEVGRAGAGGGGSPLLNPKDPRIRRIPFATQRPTFQEARRCVGLLLSAFEPSAAALAAQQAAAQAAAAAEEQRQQRRQQKAQAKAAAAVAKQAAGGEGSGAGGEGSGAGGEGQGGDGAAAGGSSGKQQEVKESALHRASRQDKPDVVMSLLEGGADPCTRDARGQTPYAVAASKEVRDAFRRFMAGAPDRWDYAAAGVPSALTEEMEAAQAAKKAEKKARQKARDAERKAESEEKKKVAADAARAAMEDEIARAAAEAAALAAKMHAGASGSSKAGGKKVGGGASAGAHPSSAAAGSKAGGSKAGSGQKKGQAAQAQQAQQQPLTPEEQARRREVMAAAAEARLKALQQASSQQKLY